MFGENTLDITVVEVEPGVQPNREGNDIWWEATSLQVFMNQFYQHSNFKLAIPNFTR
jgi:hypothetical protein